jgi:hypothetical protein
MKPQNDDISREMISSFMEYMTPKQLEKLCDYAAKIYSDKRYKKAKDVRNNNNPRQNQN